MREHRIPSERLQAVAVLMLVLSGALLCGILLTSGGCAGVQSSGEIGIEGQRGEGGISVDGTEVCGEYKPRILPVGFIVCYDATGKARVCLTSGDAELMCYDRGR